MSQCGVRTRTLPLLFLATLLSACDGKVPEPPPATSSSAPVPAGPTVEITLVGTSDLHGRLAALPPFGGYLKALREKNPDGVVVVDAGDMFQGTLESNLNEGAAVIDAYKRLGYDAVAIGNHEFDYGPVGEAATVRKSAKDGPDKDARGALKARAAQAKGSFPLLAANMLEDSHPIDWPNVAPSVMVTKKGVQVGIIGVSTMNTPATTIAANVTGITMVPLADAITAQAKALREKGAKVIVVAAHAGGECEKVDVPADLSSCEAKSEIFEVARKLPSGLVNVIVAGHTHKKIAHQVAGIAIIESGSWGAAYGRVDIVVDPATGTVVKTKIHPPEEVKPAGTVEGVKTEPVKEVESELAPAIEKGKALRARDLKANLKGAFPAKYKDECALGNLVATLLLDLDPKMDVALTNGGGLRADLDPGKLTYGALYDVLPFDNRIARLTMTGRALKDTVLRSLSGHTGILSVAGAKVEEGCDGDKPKVEIVLVKKGKGEKKVADADKIAVITNEFLATKGDDFGPVDDVRILDEDPPLRDPIASAIEKKGGDWKPEDWLVPGKPRIARSKEKCGVSVKK